MKAADLTPAKAAKGVQLSALKKKHGERTAHAIVTALLTELTEFVKCDTNEAVLVKWSYKLQKDFWHLKAEEMLLAFDYGISGKYGQLYGALKYTDLVAWLNKYDEMKTANASERAAQYKDAHDPERSTLQHVKKLMGTTRFYDTK